VAPPDRPGRGPPSAGLGVAVRELSGLVSPAEPFFEAATRVGPMATEEVEGGDPAGGSGGGPDDPGAASGDGTAAVGTYAWTDFLREFGYEGDARRLESLRSDHAEDRWGEAAGSTAEDWAELDCDPQAYLGFHPAETEAVVGAAGALAGEFQEAFEAFCDPATAPVTVGRYLREHYRREFGGPPEAELDVESAVDRAGERADELAALVDERTVDVADGFEEDAFFSDDAGNTTLVNRYDLEKAVPLEKKSHFTEMERYWVNKPYAFIILFHSRKENEKKYYAIQPSLNRIETELQEYLTGKLRTSIKYADENVSGASDDERRRVIRAETRRLLDRYDLYEFDDDQSLGDRLVDMGVGPGGVGGRVARLLGYEEAASGSEQLDGIESRPEPAVLAGDPETLTEYQVEKLLYFLERDFIGYERIDPIKHDINVEDISCDGYNSPVFVYHSDYEQIISNIYHDRTELDDFVVKLAQRSGKGISKRRPQVDATLPDGSRAQLTLGTEVSDHGTNYTIRQFQEVPHTPIDLINWNTFSLDEMAFLWLCIENHKSLIFAGGTASGKTTSLNAVSLFIPSNTKIVSIEDTREVELPQRNWIASVTRPSFSDDDKGDVDEFDLLEAALRQRPDYIVMGEVRGEEGRTLFQVMSTGHTTYTTFHADNVGEVLKRFTTDPINVSKTMFTALDLVSIQSATRVQGSKVRRNKSLTEINHYDAENDEINVQDVYQWQAETDGFLKMGNSSTLEEIKFDRGWSQEKLEVELFKREVVLAYLIDRGLNTYTQVAATFQAFINDPDTILALMAEDQLERSLEDLREMESVLIDVDPKKEEMVPRPDPDAEGRREVEEILAAAEELFDGYRGERPDSVAEALMDLTPAADVEADPGADAEPGPGGALEDATADAGEPEPALDAGGESEPALDAGEDGPSPLEPGDRSDREQAAGAAVDPDAEAAEERDEASVDTDTDGDEMCANADVNAGADDDAESDADPEADWFDEPDDASGIGDLGDLGDLGGLGGEPDGDGDDQGSDGGMVGDSDWLSDDGKNATIDLDGPDEPVVLGETDDEFEDDDGGTDSDGGSEDGGTDSGGGEDGDDIDGWGFGGTDGDGDGDEDDGDEDDGDDDGGW